MYAPSVAGWPLLLIVAFLFPLSLCIQASSPPPLITLNNVETWANQLGDLLDGVFRDTTKSADIIQAYEHAAETEEFDPRQVLKDSKKNIEAYLEKRAKAAWKAKTSLQANEYDNLSSAEDLNDKDKNAFVRFMSAKMSSNEVKVYRDGPLPEELKTTTINATEVLNFTRNPNFYGRLTCTEYSAVHVPTPLFNREPTLLRHIRWSKIDPVYKNIRDKDHDISFQFFCSESGFMRYYPSAPWVYDAYTGADTPPLDLFDCRSTNWYINGATLSKNMLIMLDMSGSMHGQRREIALQTIETIMETLSDNDFFNIMTFSKKPQFLDSCAEKSGMIQATMRNKKLMRTKLSNVTAGDKADFEVALEAAFKTLLNLPPANWTTLDALSKMEEAGERPFNKTIVTFGGHVLGLTSDYLDAISNATGEREVKMGCNSVIMLITDGAPDHFQEIFDTYNKNKTIRLFSYLIGEEATDFEQVRWMACFNKGFMVHIQNLADVQEKVQKYIKVMSRPLAHQADAISESDAVWSGVYRERLFSNTPVNGVRVKRARYNVSDPKTEKLVTTVSYPVVFNDSFMGVAGVAVPIVELRQLIPNFKLGPLSYSFMMDNNGFVMFHPQLRAIEMNTKQFKPNFNSMDILEMEVPQEQRFDHIQPVPMTRAMLPTPVLKRKCVPGIPKNLAEQLACIHYERWLLTDGFVTIGLNFHDSEMRTAMIKCNNSKPEELNIFYATDELGHIYRQTNTYYAECIEGALFTIGVAVARGDTVQIKRKQDLELRTLSPLLFEGKNWRIHPEWRYCIVNDTDANLTPEEAFTIYAAQMKTTGEWPTLCLDRRDLVDRLLLDIVATNTLEMDWQKENSFTKERGVHLVFFATQSGLIRFLDDLRPDEVAYADPNWEEPGINATVDIPQGKYEHFIKDNNNKSSQDSYFQRAVRMKGRIVFDTNPRTKVWYKSEQTSAFGHQENVSFLLTATKALYLNDKALIGVVGIEMLYDNLAASMASIGCGPSDEQQWCFLLDEHAYIVYSSLNTTRYTDPFSPNPYDRWNNYLGKWFGRVNLITEATFTLLKDKGFYSEVAYTDYQALCQDSSYNTNRGLRLLSSFFNLFKGLQWIGVETWKLLTEYTILGLISSIIRPTEAYTASFPNVNEGLPCDKVSNFYLANWGIDNWKGDHENQTKATALVDGNNWDKPCPLASSECAVKMYASWVPHTNLLLVAIEMMKNNMCYNNEAKCPAITAPKFHFGFSPVFNASDKHMSDIPPTEPDPDDESGKCRHVLSKERKASNKCIVRISEEEELPCSRTAVIRASGLLLLAAAVLSRLLR